MPKKNVFISMGFPYTESQKGFLDALIELLRSCDIEPRAMNKIDYPTGSPLKDISRVLRECHGAIVVAFERTYFESGLEKQQTPLKSVRYATPWNQIEASLAFGLGIPLFVLMEPGLREEGLLEQKFDWYVDRVTISAAALSDKDVRNRIMAWCRHVQTAKAPENRGKIDGETTIRELMQMFTFKSAAALAGLMFGIFVFGMAIGRTAVGTFFLSLVGKS
jgi:hypothetical protein